MKYINWVGKSVQKRGGSRAGQEVGHWRRGGFRGRKHRRQHCPVSVGGWVRGWTNAILNDVGNNFSTEARKIHYDKKSSQGIYGKATPEETEFWILTKLCSFWKKKSTILNQVGHSSPKF